MMELEGTYLDDCPICGSGADCDCCVMIFCPDCGQLWGECDCDE